MILSFAVGLAWTEICRCQLFLHVIALKASVRLETVVGRQARVPGRLAQRFELSGQWALPEPIEETHSSTLEVLAAA